MASLQDLVDTGHLSDAAIALHRKPRLSTSEKVLQAFLTAELQGFAAALPAIDALEREELSPRDEAIRLELRGRVVAYEGNVDEGIRLLEQASRIVQTLKDPIQLARSEVRRLVIGAIERIAGHLMEIARGRVGAA